MNKFYQNEIYPIGLALTTDFSWLQKEYVHTDGSDIEDHPESLATTGFFKRKTTEYHAVAVGICFRQHIDANTLAHEAFHATRFTMESIPIPLGDDSEEGWAYYIGWVAQCIFDFAEELKKTEEEL